MVHVPLDEISALFSYYHAELKPLLGSRKDRYSPQHHRLKPHVNTLYDASKAEVLIGRSKWEDREIMLKRNNDAIAKWLDRQYEDHAKAMKSIDQQTGQTSILSFM